MVLRVPSLLLCAALPIGSWFFLRIFMRLLNTVNENNSKILKIYTQGSGWTVALKTIRGNFMSLFVLRLFLEKIDSLSPIWILVVRNPENPENAGT